MGKSKRVCEICHAPIAKEWDNEHHYGTCPSCKRGANFIIENKELQHIAEQENKKQSKKYLLNHYNVLSENNNGFVRVNCINMAKLIYNECGMFFKTIEDEDTGKQEIYYYDNGYYHPGGENRIKEVVDDYLDEQSSIHRKNEVVDFIRHKNSVDREHLEPPVHLINLKNGIYNLKEDKLEKHNPDYFFLNQIPVEYDSKADCPTIKQFFKDVLYEEYVKVAQEMFGYSIYRSYKYHKAFLLYGGGRNGKSTMLKLLEIFIGKHNYANNSLTDLLENRFAKASLYGKLVNIGSEISGKSLADTSQFKHLTGGDSIRAEKKFYGSFSFNNYAKLIFNANHIPYSRYDKSTAYFQRWIILVFPETFQQGDKKTDPDILNKLTTKKEIQGLLIWAIEGLKRLLKTDRFSYTDDDDEESVGERYELLARPEKRFIVDHIELVPGEYLDTDKVFEKYDKWAEDRRYPVLAKSSFSRSMKKYLVDKDKKLACEVVSTSRSGKSKRMYKNIQWKDMPSNSLRLDSFEDKNKDFGDKKLHEKISSAKEIIQINKDAGYSITMEWLQKQFSDGFINNMVEAGMLIRKPDGTYDIN